MITPFITHEREEDTTIALKSAPAPKPPTIPPERALRIMTEQLDSLQKLKNRNYQEATGEETEWEHFTESIIADAFGDPSMALSNFYAARHVGGRFQLGPISSQQHQTALNSGWVNSRLCSGASLRRFGRGFRKRKSKESMNPATNTIFIAT